MPLSPTVTRELLKQLEHFPKKKLGQNFLIDGNIVRKSIELAELDADSCVVEIGPVSYTHLTLPTIYSV